MVKTLSKMPDLGLQAPSFSLPNVMDNSIISLKDFAKESPVLVMFICNHCPYVVHIVSSLTEVSMSLQNKGISVVAINSNDVKNFPEDSPENMKLFAKKYNFSFPYLFDETQEIAKAFQAACTPDFFLFDKRHKLYYRGQFDSSRPGNKLKVCGSDLMSAADQMMAGHLAPNMQIPSMGCNIKWRVDESKVF